MMFVLKVVCCLLLTLGLNEAKKVKGSGVGNNTEQSGGPDVMEPFAGSALFRLHTVGEDTCTLDPLQLHTLTSCGFNSTNPLIIITHGWSLDGMMESWVPKMATVLKTNLVDVNVVITDWLTRAYQLYPSAVASTRTVGRDMAHLLRSLQDEYQFPLSKVHLIGYSLGAHISGFAGSFLEGSGKIGRITGLDPAGPFFEGSAPEDRLSPDDAAFVDVIHTYTRGSAGLSVGIQQAVGHYDFYPNGGNFQPGCGMSDFKNMMQFIKCPHERSVHLFIDSVQNRDQQSVAFRCSNMDAFNKGACLDCRKNRCNTMGYRIKKVSSGRPKKLYLKTRPTAPYKLYHYQLKIKFLNPMERMAPSLSLSLTGTQEESGHIPISFSDKILANKTYTFLITQDQDLGDLMILRLNWDHPAVWRNMWSRVRTIWGRGESLPQLTFKTIYVKSGDSQQRTTFCAQKDPENVEGSHEGVFVRCQNKTPRQHRRKLNL